MKYLCMYVCMCERACCICDACVTVSVCDGGVLVQKGVYCNKVIKVSEIKAKISLTFGIS